MYNLKIVHHNIRSIKDKINELKLFIKTHEPDIITLNETLNINKSLKIPNYTITQPINNIDRGVAIIHKNNINIDILPPIPTTKPTKNLQHSILIHTPTDSIQISTIYCPNKAPSTEILEGIMKRNEKTIFTGDFNSRHEDFGHDKNDKSGRTLVEITNKHKYTKLNDNQPTYTNDRTGKEDVKDLIFSSPQMFLTFREFWVDEDLGSDHNTIIATFSHKGIIYTSPPKEIYLYHKADWQKINNNIENEMKKHQINHNSSHIEINNHIEKLTNTITENIKNNVKKIKIQPHKIGLPPFIRELIKTKHKTRKQYQKTRHEYYKTEYNRLNKQIKTLIKQEHKNNWETKCNDLELKDNQDNTWKQLNQMMGSKKPKTKFPTLIIPNKNDKTKVIKYTKPEEKIQILTNTFKGIFTQDNIKPYFDNEHKINTENELKKYTYETSTLRTLPSNYLETEHKITKSDIETTINELSTKTAHGPDNISNKIIKNIKPSILNILYTLYNISWHKGYHSTNWKTPLTILFNKPDKPKSDPNNYRPISLINSLSKILEKIIKVKLTNWAEDNNKINDEQAGFRANKSTLDKIFQLTQTTRHAKNMKIFSAAVFMDVEKAFDKVWHDGLILTLIKMGLPKIYIRYIKSFISQRYMYFKIQNIESPKIKLNFGVPQGSSLSPILFLLYVSDIPKPKSHNSYISQFADDIKIYSTSPSLPLIQSNLQKSMDQIIKYCGKRRISINEKKSFELIFRKRTHISQAEENAKPIMFLNKPIPFEKTGKFLGVSFDNTLSFKNHIINMKSKAKNISTRLHTLHDDKYGPSNQTMVRLFKIYVRPLLEYGHIATITAHKLIQTHWEPIQTTYIRRILKLHKIHNDHTRKLANLPTIYNRLLHLANKWYKKTQTNNKQITNFINTTVSKNSKLENPYSIITKKYISNL